MTDISVGMTINVSSLCSFLDCHPEFIEEPQFRRISEIPPLRYASVGMTNKCHLASSLFGGSGAIVILPCFAQNGNICLKWTKALYLYFLQFLSILRIFNKEPFGFNFSPDNISFFKIFVLAGFLSLLG